MVLGVIILNFLIFHIIPGEPLYAIPQFGNLVFNPPELGPPNPLRLFWGLGQPLPVQFVIYVRNMLTFQFGISFSDGSPVTDHIAARLPVTLLLMVFTVFITLILDCITRAFRGITKKGSKLERGVSTSAHVFRSLPVFLLGIILLLVFLYFLNITPSYETFITALPRDPLMIALLIGGYLFPPSVILALFLYGSYMLVKWDRMDEVSAEEHIVTAHVKGVDELDILSKHAARDAVLPMKSVIITFFGMLIGGAILTETVFNLPGLGNLLVGSVLSQNYPVTNAVFFLLALATIAAGFFANIIFHFLDPRIRSVKEMK